MKEELQSLIIQSQHYIKSLRQLRNPSSMLQLCSSAAQREISRSIARFDSKLILMATIGSVKSGKSTLTNCLSRRNLCATQLGIETTRLPLIILASSDGTERMELYSPKATYELSEKELFSHVVDHLRGVASDDFERKINLDRRALNAENLSAWAEGRTQARCASIYLVEPEAALLKEGVAIIDMPGMDGLQSNWQDEHLHSWMNQNADYFLLVQSSFAAITPDTRLYLKEAMQQSPRPIRVVQNRIEAQFWKGEEGQSAQQLEQQKNTQKILSEMLEKIIPSSSLNAGHSWWNIEQKKRGESITLADKDQLKPLEEDILNDLSDGAAILESNSLDHLHKRLESTDTQLKESRQQAEDHLSHIHELENSIKKLMDRSELRDAIENKNLHEGRMRCKYLADEAKERLFQRLDQILDITITGYLPEDWPKRAYSGEELNHVRQKIEADLGELLSEQETDVLSPDKYCELTSLELEKISSCADILQRREKEALEQDFQKAILDAWKNTPLNGTPVALSELVENRFFGMMTCRYDYNELAPRWRSEARDIIAQRFSRWCSIVGENLDSFINKRMDALEQCLGLEWSHYQKSEQIGRTKAQSLHDIEVIDALREKLVPILHLARQLVATK